LSEIIDNLLHPALEQAVEENHKSAMYHLGDMFAARFYHELGATWWITDPIGFNQISHTSFTTETPESEIDKVLQHISRSSPSPFTWNIGPSTRNAKLEHRLQANGWSKNVGGPAMILDLDNLQEEQLNLPTGLTIQIIEDDDTYNQYIDTMSAGFEFPEPMATYQKNIYHVLSDPTVHLFLGFFAGKPVAISLMHRNAGLAGIYNVAVVPQMRQRGIGRAMTLAALFDARDLGYRIAMLESSKMGLPLYRDLGFQKLFTFDQYTSPIPQ
jgi:ribosomal protein S18 acetylase RimI-like enzyme